MKHVAAYMLAVLGGNASPSAADVKKILAAVDAKVDDAALDKVVSELSGKNLEEVIEAGQKKMASVSVAAPAAGGAAPLLAAAVVLPLRPRRPPSPSPRRTPTWVSPFSIKQSMQCCLWGFALSLSLASCHSGNRPTLGTPLD